MEPTNHQSLKQKLMSSLSLASCRFHKHHHQTAVSALVAKPRPLDPDIKEKLMSHLASCVGKQTRRRIPSSSGFRYDALSYSLNFDESTRNDRSPSRNFISRLPPSPLGSSTALPGISMSN